MRTATRAAVLLTSAQVSALEPEERVEVCDEFVAVFCATTPPPPYDTLCTPCFTDEMCALPGVGAAMAGECGSVTVGQVRDCAEGRTAGVCAEQTGGCMLQVSATLCP